MAGLNWPSDLPDCFLEGSFVEGMADNTIRMSYGNGGVIADIRRRSTSKPFPVAGEMVMSTDQWDVFKAFFGEELDDGALAFDLPAQGGDEHETTDWVCRFTAPPSRTCVTEDLWLVSFALEVLATAIASSDLAPALFTDADIFYEPGIAGGGGIVSALFSDADTFYAPRVSRTKVYPSLYDDADAFYSPSLIYRLAPGLVTDADAIYQPEVRVLLRPALFTDGDTFYAPQIVPDQALAPSLYTDTDTFYAPQIIVDQFLVPSLYTDTDTFYAPTVAPPISFSMTAGNFFGVIVGYSNGSQFSAFGSIDAEPISGSSLMYLTSGSVKGISFTGNQTALLAGKKVWVDGVSYPFTTDWAYSGFTTASWSSGNPSFTSGNTYSVEIK